MSFTSTIWRVATVVLLVALLGGAYVRYKNMESSATQQGQQAYAQVKEQQNQLIEQQESSLGSQTGQTYVGTTFSITVPAGWGENQSLETQWASYGQSKVWTTQENMFGALQNAKDEELHVVWGPDTTGSKLSGLEQIDLNDAQNYPNKYALEHPSIPGATQTFLSYDRGAPSDTFDIKLYVHAQGTLYMVIGNLESPTADDIAGIKAAVLSFRPQ